MYSSTTVKSAYLHGTDVVVVEIDVAIAAGVPGFGIYGLTETCALETKERVRQAIHSCGFSMPHSEVFARIRSNQEHLNTTSFNLAIAVGILIASEQISPNLANDFIYVGELTHDGQVLPVRGMFAYIQQLTSQTTFPQTLICAPTEEATFASLLDQPLFLSNLAQLKIPDFAISTPDFAPNTTPVLDYADIIGYNAAKRALIIAAAGGHNALLVGAPGSTKTMLASRFTTILPPMTETEKIETATIHSMSRLPLDSIYYGQRPFRSPHKTITAPGLVGGGFPVCPGEVSLAHNGVLFLNDLQDFPPYVLRHLRPILDQNTITIARADSRVCFPARFQLLAATWPCACGFFKDTLRPCTCSESERERFWKLDFALFAEEAFDMHISIQRQEGANLLKTEKGISSSIMQDIVVSAQEFTKWREEKYGRCNNNNAQSVIFHSFFSDSTNAYTSNLAAEKNLSTSSLLRLLRVARTIADMEESTSVESHHLDEAALYAAF